MNIFLLNYNNKYNRIVKKPLADLNTYVSDGAVFLAEFNDVRNWNPNDGITTSQIVNYDGDIPDYVLVADDYGNMTRWFCTEAQRIRAKQFRLTLVRDVISDYYNDIINAPCYIERAMAREGDPALYNSEHMELNQILTNKEFLTDRTGCPWIVGYVPKDYPEGEAGKIDFEFFPAPDYTVSNIKEWEYYSILGKKLNYPKFYAETVYIREGSAQNYRYSLDLDLTYGQNISSSDYSSIEWFDTQYFSPFNSGRSNADSDVGALIAEDVSITELGEKVQSEIDKLNSPMVYSACINMLPYGLPEPILSSLVGKSIRDESTGIYYIVKSNHLNEDISITVKSGNVWEKLKSVFINDDMTTQQFRLVGYVDIIEYELEIVGSKGKVEITKTRTTLQDQPYDMFCIPYSDDIYFRQNMGDGEYIDRRYSKSMAMSLAQQIAADLGKDAIYDVQILPFCPVISLFEKDGDKKIMLDKGDYSNSRIVTEEDYDETDAIGAIFWVPFSKFSFSIPYKIELPTSPVDLKLFKMCNKYRLCSPNMASFFDFSPVSNGGVEFIDVDCYYKPYSPYIHLNPRFSGLYAKNVFEYEVRGLDLNGNFSLTQVSDAWSNYELNNKNYRNMFDRQMEYLEVQREPQRFQQALSGFTGALGAGVQTGLSTGNVYAGIAGAAVSGVGAAIDYGMSEKLYQENIKYQRSMFDYNLRNIKALPNSLTSVDALSPNNPIFPYIELYTCTEVEKSAARSYLKYNGMNIGRIGTIAEFIQKTPSFIKGNILRFEGLKDDLHVAEVIAQEIMIGVYI